MDGSLEPLCLTGRELAVGVVVLLVVSASLMAWLPEASIEDPELPSLPEDLPASHFDGNVANLTVWAQEHMGPRLPGSENASRLRAYLAATLDRYGWNVTEQAFASPELDGTTVTNLIARRGPDEDGGGRAPGPGSGPLYMVGAHYDTRPFNDGETDNVSSWQPIPGANDGGSGVAVLLELARVLQPATLTSEVWLVLFDGEDHGPGSSKMFLGSKYFSEREHLEESIVQRTEAFVLLDMVGDADLGIPREGNSDGLLLDELYTIAAALNESAFENRNGRAVTDDHVYVGHTGIPVADLIDFDYGGPGPGGPLWHTLNDTRDKVAAGSLASVGRVVETWLRLKATDPYGGGTGGAGGDGGAEGAWDSPPPLAGTLQVTKDALLGPGLFVLKDLNLSASVKLEVANGTVALAGNLTLGEGARLVLVDSILASSTAPDGRVPASNFHLSEGAGVNLTRSEWWGPPV